VTWDAGDRLIDVSAMFLLIVLSSSSVRPPQLVSTPVPPTRAHSAVIARTRYLLLDFDAPSCIAWLAMLLACAAPATYATRSKARADSFSVVMASS
jgi:hypothetical protein